MGEYESKQMELAAREGDPYGDQEYSRVYDRCLLWCDNAGTVVLSSRVWSSRKSHRPRPWRQRSECLLRQVLWWEDGDAPQVRGV